MEQDTTTTARFDLPRLIKDLGGPTRVRSLLFAHNMKMISQRNMNALSQGQHSGGAANIALLCALARRLDPAFEAGDYVIEEQESEA